MTLDLARRADLWGDRPAVVDRATNRTLSYADLDEMADETACRLATAGVGAGDAVIVLARNRPEWFGLFFGARRLGATLAPVSHRLPADTVAKLCERIGPALALAEPRFDDQVGAVDDADVRVEPLDEFEARDPGEFDPEDFDPVDEPGTNPPLYLHTGGTTGVPKVVVVEDEQVEWNCVTEVAAWGLGKETVAPVLLPLFHTGGWHLLTLPTLYVGGRVVLQREFDPGATLDLIEERGATNVFGVAAIFRAMADAEGFAEADFSSVEWFMSGGGPTPEAVADAYRDRGQRFVQGYGLTEGGPNDLYFEPGRDDSKPASVGRPFPDCEARVVSKDGEVLSSGETGELELRGPVTADRYLETEDGTFEGEWVSTGDLARRDDDGDYYVVGRTDNMFVSGGENVYPERIEDALSEHPAVEAVGVIGIAHEKWGTVPKAVVVGDAGRADAGNDAETETPGAEDDVESGTESVDAEELASFARDRLADHEIPRAFAFADSLPESGPGKLDRAELERRYTQ